MGRTLKMLVVPALALVVGLVAGAALGQRQGFGMGMGFLEAETGYSLGMHVEAASCIRVGDTDCALTLLDATIDAAVLNLDAQPEQDRVRRPMSQAKVYRRVVPAQGPTAAAVQAALADVLEPETNPERQTSGLERLIARSGGLGRGAR